MLKSTRCKSCKLLSLVLSMLIVVTTVPAFEFIAVAADGNGLQFGEIKVYYKTKPTECDILYGVTGYTGSDAVVTVPSSDNGRTVEYIAEYAFADNKDITIVRLPDTIRGIGKSAFTSCAKLNTIVIGTNASVSDFGDFSAYPAALESFTSIVDDRAFANCGALRHFAVYTGTKPSDLSVSTLAAPLSFVGCTDVTYYGWGVDNVVLEHANTVSAVYKNLSPVIEKVKGISVAPKSVFMALKETMQLTVTILPNDSSEYGGNICSFISSDPKVATVSDNGVITAVGFGTAIISATSINGFTDTCTVTVAERLEGNYVYRFLDDGTVEIVGFNSGVTGIVEIPDTIVGKTVSSIGDYAFLNCSGIREIKLPDTIEKIGIGAFYDCTELALFKTSPNLKTIGSSAFYGCSSLAFIDFSNSKLLKSIGDAAFRNCTSLAAVFLPESLLTIGKDSFAGDIALKILSVAGNNLSLDTDVIYFDPLAPLTIYSKDNNLNLSSYAAIRSIAFSSEIADVTALAFPSLKTSLILGEMTTVSVDAIVGIDPVSNYDTVAFAVDNKNVIIFKNGKLTAVGMGPAKLYVIAPNGLYEYIDIVVECGEFSDYKYRFIENMAKAEIIGLTNTNLKSAEIPEFVVFGGTNIPVTSIGNAAFENSAVTSITLGAGITSVNGASFDCAYALEAISVKSGNNSYTAIDGVLYNKSETTLIKYPASKTGYECDIQASITSIGDFAFKDNKHLVHIKFPANLTRIGDHSFESMEMLMSAALPSQVTNIGNFAFAYNSKLDYIVVPKAASSIGASAFIGTPVTIYGHKGYYAEEYAIDDANRIPFKDASLLVEVSELRLSPKSVSLKLTDVCKLSVDVYPAAASYPVYFYRSSDPTVATVGDDGTITAISVGEATITVMSSRGVFAECAVEVVDSSTGDPSGAENAVSVAVILLPDKLIYENGEELDFTGGLVEATLQDGEVTKTVTIIDGEGKIASGVRIRRYDAYKAGSQTIEIIYGKVYTNISVEVLPRKLTGIAVTKLPDELTYIEGTQVDTNGLEVTAYYNNGQSEIVSDYNVSAVPSKIGNHDVTVSYGGFTAKFGVTIIKKTLTAVEITSPTKTVYVEGEELELSGFSATAHYNNGTIKSLSISDFTFKGYAKHIIGEQNITATYTEDGKTINKIFKVTVNPRTLTGIQIIRQPDKQRYILGETLDITGLEVVANYNNSTYSVLSPAYMFEFENMLLSLGDNFITIGYKENDVTYTASFKVFVEYGNYNNEFTYEMIDGEIKIVKALEGASGKYTIPASVDGKAVKAISYNAFRKNSTITSIVIPNSVTSIGVGAFDECISLASVAIGNGVTKIPDKAFYKCKSLKSVIIPSSVTEIGELAFARCDALESVTIPSSVVKIDETAFNYNNKNFKIISAKNSTAHQYALDNKVKWEADIGYILGDVNGNGKVEVDDARLALRHTVGLQTLDSKAVIRTDYNKDGEVSVDDARRILRKAVGLD